jgi:hypothetical protein
MNDATSDLQDGTGGRWMKPARARALAAAAAVPGSRPRLPARVFYDRLAEPCTEPVTYHVVDAEGGGLDLCAGHAVDARARILGVTVMPLS